MRILRIGVCLLVLMILPLLAGCGGGGGDDETRISGRLSEGDYVVEDGTLADVYEFRAREDGRARIEMLSDDLDCYLAVYRIFSDDSVEFITDDEDDGSGSAEVFFDVDDGARYGVLVNSVFFETGSYRLFFSEELEDIRQVDPDDLRSSGSAAGGRASKLTAMLSANKQRQK